MQASFSKGLETIKKKDVKLLSSFTKTKNTRVETSRRSEEAGKQTGDMGDKGSKSHSIRRAKGKRTKQKKKTRKGPMRGPASAAGEGAAAAKQTSFQGPLPTPSICPPCCQGAPGEGQLLIRGGEGGAQEETWEAVN